MAERRKPGPGKKKWTLLRKLRWAVYLVFLGFMIFFSVCLAVGIISNLRWRFTDLDLPMDRPESLSELGSLQLRDCLSALQTMRSELESKVCDAISGSEDRDRLLAGWKSWSGEWSRRLDKLGTSCRLTEFSYADHPTLALLAEIYRLLEYFHGLHTMLVKRFATENAVSLRRMSELIERAREKIEQLEGRPVESPP